ncbi:protein adenylyltransferase SelO [Ostreibacterium oceani]|uniref:Protein nucleotidyltransferase YdiU n=1 Tax=Ostreibacterium oceani TaxID=2654998 RepID=A0A6N7EYY8_9GAMM|nr:YdiU family protein [Ostreibacterium oceani]MPV85698.1 YdiU family protein [Ostreibacterium oceani]
MRFQFEHSYQQLPDCFFSRVAPLPASQPLLVIFNHALANTLGLDWSALSDEAIATALSGVTLPENADPIAQAYAGHQFGHFTQLGDGRAHLLGEHRTPQGERLDIQLKGAGPTPYARRGDGRAALGPMLREYLISEAMHALNIPTTRSLAVTATGDPVYREDVLAGAVLTRVAQSHLRFGTFQYTASTGQPEFTQHLLNYAINRHFPDCANHDNPALAFLQAVCDKHVTLVTDWLRVGFIHGVMNTDNMTISGETIDYGPCAFMDTYHPDTVFSSIDRQGRYAFANQPTMAQWNCARLAETLLPLIDSDTDQAIKQAEACVNGFSNQFTRAWRQMMANKLGLIDSEAQDDSQNNSQDNSLIEDLLQWMQTNQADYTNTFVALTAEHLPDDSIYHTREFQQWHSAWQTRIAPHLPAAKQTMKDNNPLVIPRNHQVAHALSAAESGDMAPFMALLFVLQKPYQTTSDTKKYQSPPAASERVYQTFCGT